MYRSYTIVAFYTEHTPYAMEIKGLMQSCATYGIPIITKGYKSRGSWVQNAAIKPEFLLWALENVGGRLVYLDADARLRAKPILFERLDTPLAVHYRRGELLTGTIFFDARAKATLEQWLALQQQHPTTWDQKVLAQVVGSKATPLPPEYCQIFDTMSHHGSPIIEHMQASRRFKKLVNEQQVDSIPNILHGTRIRRHADGSYWLAKKDKRVESYLDRECVRVPGVLRWLRRLENRIAVFRDSFQSRECYIVGKGPSLDALVSSVFEPNLPIIALNEAIHVVESLNLPNPTFALQQDAKLRDSCKPKRSPIFVATKAANYYPDGYIFENTQMGLSFTALSVSAAMTIAKLLGCVGFRMVSFDACVSGVVGYSKTIPYANTWGGPPKRFLSHKAKILLSAAELPISWITPGDHAEACSDKSQQ